VSRLRPVDILVLAYAVLISITALARDPRSSGTWWLVLAHVLVIALVCLVTRPGLGRFGTIIREVYPVLILVALYGAIDVLNESRGTGVHDYLVRRWEQWVFGEQVSHEWWQRAPSSFWSLVLHGSYLMYYVIIPLPLLVFLLRGDQRALRRSVLMTVSAFLVCYLFFVFFPVAGPYYAFPRPDQRFLANPAAQAVYRILAGGSSYGAAFPSSHVAATIAATIAAWLGSRTLGILLTIPTLLLTVGVVYTQMHYGVDVIAGIAVALAAVSAAALAERRTSPGAA